MKKRVSLESSVRSGMLYRWRFPARLNGCTTACVLGSFTTPQRDTVAIEPVSHVNNALSLVHAGADAAGLGLAILPPGKSLSAQMTIAVERVS